MANTELETLAKRVFSPVSENGLGADLLLVGEHHTSRSAPMIIREMLPELKRQHIHHLFIEADIFVQVYFDANRAGVLGDSQIRRIYEYGSNFEPNGLAELITDLHKDGFQVHAVNPRRPEGMSARQDFEKSETNSLFKRLAEKFPDVLKMDDLATAGYKLGLPADIITARVIASRLPPGERGVVIYGDAHMSGFSPCGDTETDGILDEGLQSLGLKTVYVRASQNLAEVAQIDRLQNIQIENMKRNHYPDESINCTAGAPIATILAESTFSHQVLYNADQLRIAQKTGISLSEELPLLPIGNEKTLNSPDPWELFSRVLSKNKKDAALIRGTLPAQNVSKAPGLAEQIRNFPPLVDYPPITR